MLSTGPRPQTHSDRLALVQQLSERLQVLHTGEVVAIALYGSVARGQDGPYSDVEMLCIVDQPEMDVSYEWVYGNGKAEINVLGRNDARWEAKEVEQDWAITKGCFLDARLVYGDRACLDELRDLVLSVSETEINAVIRRTSVDELYEWLGKARNALHRKRYSGLANLACKYAEMISLLLGLANRTCYTTGLQMLDESLQFESLPAGYSDLCELVCHGKLDDPVAVVMAIEAAWSGIVSWAAQRDIQMMVDPWPFL